MAEIKFLAANGDPDLNYALGDAESAGVRVFPTVRRSAATDGSISYATESVSLQGNVTDLYDFDIDTAWPADAAAAVQTGFNGGDRKGGNVFKIEVQLQSSVTHVQAF